MPKAETRHMTTTEANLMAGARSVVQALRAELAHERSAHDLTRGDLQRANDRISELEAAVGFLIADDEPPTAPAIPAAMKAAERNGSHNGY